MPKYIQVAILASVSSLALAQPAFAGQEAKGSGDGQATTGEIVVTAQKRSESIQRTALAVTAVSGQDLRAKQMVSVAAIAQQVPNLNVSEQIGQARITMRGIGVDNVATGAEGSIAFNQDGVFFSRSAAALASFYDLERIEVLRGPQGTLYGRNATGGSVNLVTKKPDFGPTNGYLTITGGNFGTLNTEAAIGTALSDTVAIRIAQQTQHHTGYGRNILDGKDIDSRDSQAIRGEVLIRPSAGLNILLGADYFQSDDSSNGYHYFGPGGLTAAGAIVTPTGILLGGQVPATERDISSTIDPHATSKFYGVRADVSYQLSDTVAVRSLTAFRHSAYTLLTDISPLGNQLFPMNLGEKSDQFSQEFQVNVETDRNKLVAGAYYLHEKIDGFLLGPFNLQAVGGPNLLMQGYYAGGTLKTDALAAFGQDTFTIKPGLRVTVGARYSWERKAVNDIGAFDVARTYSPANQPVGTYQNEHRSFGSFTPKIGLDYDLGPRTLVYATWSRGFKAGTYNLGAQTPALRPETVDAASAGIKTTTADRRLRANIEGFYYKYKNLQVGKVSNFQLILENAATATIYGLEGEFTVRPLPLPLTITSSASWLHARFDSYLTADPSRPAGDGVTVDPDTGLPGFNLHGYTLPQAPNYVINLGAEYEIPTSVGKFTLRGESTWSDRVYFSPFNRSNVSQAPYSLQNASIVYSSNDRHWQVTAYIRNIADKIVKASGQVATPYVGSPVIGFLQPPRTFGAALTYNF